MLAVHEDRGDGTALCGQPLTPWTNSDGVGRDVFWQRFGEGPVNCGRFARIPSETPGYEHLAEPQGESVRTAWWRRTILGWAHDGGTGEQHVDRRELIQRSMTAAVAAFDDEDNQPPQPTPSHGFACDPSTPARTEHGDRMKRSTAKDAARDQRKAHRKAVREQERQERRCFFMRPFGHEYVGGICIECGKIKPPSPPGYPVPRDRVPGQSTPR